MNPALPGGAVADSDATGGQWSLAARTSYTFVPYEKMQQGTQSAPNPNELGVAVHLGMLQVQAVAPTATSLDLQLPFGALSASSLMEDRTDSGLGDLELRVRQARSRRAWSAGATLGAVLPTGPYVARAGAANLAPEASYLTLGRGVPWAIAELDGRLAVGRWWSVFAQLSLRSPLGRSDDGFAWGREQRSTLGGRCQVTHRLSAVLTVDAQWRAGATEPDPFAGGRIATANAGGWQWTTSLAATHAIGESVAVTIGTRVPLHADVTGNQLVPSIGGFVAVSYTRALSRPGRRPRVHPGKITIVDYRATWCKPCVEIARRLAEAAPRWPDVEIVEVDATAWPDKGVELPTGAVGLPVIEVFDPKGRRIELLLGEAALGVVETIDRIRAAGSGVRSTP